MPILDHELPLIVKVTDRDNMERQLNAAVLSVREKAMGERRQGILFTRHAADEFTVALSDMVPFGLTREIHDW